MKKITKTVARKFFDIPVQTVLSSNGRLIASVDAYVKDGEMVDLKAEDIEHLNITHYSGWDLDETIYSNETGERLESLEGIDNKDFLVWFAEQIDCDVTGWDETREFMGFERDIRAERLCTMIFNKLFIIADFTDEEKLEVQKRAESLEK